MQTEATTEGLKLLFSKRESATALAVSPRKVDYMIANKLIRATKIGRRTLIHRREIERLARDGAA
jgi:excisionase family DNA binding protein